MATDSCDRTAMQARHSGRSTVSVAMSVAFAGMSLSSSHDGHFDRSSAGIALAPLTAKAWFSAHGGCGCPGIYEADLEVVRQAAVAIGGWVLANQKLPEFHDGISPEPNVRSHRGALCGLESLALGNRGVDHQFDDLKVRDGSRWKERPMSVERRIANAANGNKGAPRAWTGSNGQTSSGITGNSDHPGARGFG